MSEDANQEQQESVQEERMFTKAELDEILNKEVEGLKNKRDELLGKLKDYQAQTEQVKSEAEKAKEEALKKSGDIEELKAFYDKKQKEIEENYSSQLAQMKDAIKERDKQEVINKIVGDFVDSETGSFMLKNLVEVEDGSQKFKDFSGNIVADNLEDFRKWMNTNPHMAHFVRGTNATGGNASGSKVASNSRTEMSRKQFDSLEPAERMKFIKEGGKTYDE